MWLSQLRRLGPLPNISFGGVSDSTGFLISMTCIGGSESRVRYQTPDGEDPVEEVYDWAMVGLVLGVVGTGLWLHWWWLATASAVLCTPRYYHRGYRAWHWCEHQVVQLLEEGLVPSEALLNRQTGVSIRCGSMRIGAKMVIVGGLTAYLTGMFTSDDLLWRIGALAVASGVAARLYRIAEILYDESFGKWLFWIFLGIAIPTLLITMTIQRVMFLRLPSQRQRNYTLDWGKRASLTSTLLLLHDAREYALRKSSAATQ